MNSEGIGANSEGIGRDSDLLLDEGDPRATPRAYRRALGQFATGVAVIAAVDGDRDLFITVNSFGSLSLDPPLVQWSLRTASSKLDAFRRATHFAASVLAPDQVEVANRFARSEGRGDIAILRGRGGAPVLAGAAATFECRRTAEHEAGDHVLFVGEVEHYRCFDRAGLLFAQGRYGLAIDHPAGAPSPAEALAGHPLDDFLLPLLLRAYVALSAQFDQHREALGLDLDASKVLAWLAAHPGASVASIAQATLLGVSAAEDSVAGLVGRSLVAPRPPGAVQITEAGRQLVATMLQRAREFEREKLAPFDADTVAAVHRVLGSLAGRG